MSTKLKKLILSIPTQLQGAPNLGPVPPPETFMENTDGYERQCVRTVERANISLDSLAAFTARADSLWPGSIIQGAGIQHGQLNPIGVDRSPGTIVLTSLEVGSPPPHTVLLSDKVEDIPVQETVYYSRRVKNPSLATVEEARNEILRQHYKAPTPARILVSIQEFNSVEEGMLHIGASAGWASAASIRGAFNRRDYERRSNLIVKFWQIYYDISFEAPKSPVSVFSSRVDVSDLEPYVQPDQNTGTPNPPLYISSVAYGRQLILVTSTNYRKEELNAALRASLKIGLGSGGVQLDTHHQEIINHTDIQGIVLGGDGTPAVEIFANQQKLWDWMRAGANFSKDSPALPIAYNTRFLKNNVQAELLFTADKHKVTCGTGRRVETIYTHVPDHNGKGHTDFTITYPTPPLPNIKIISVSYRCEGPGCGWCYPMNRSRVPWPSYDADYLISLDQSSVTMWRHCDGPAANFYHDIVIEQTGPGANFLPTSKSDTKNENGPHTIEAISAIKSDTAEGVIAELNV